MSILEQASGARMHTALYRPFTVDKTGLSQIFFRELSFFLTRAVRSLAGAFCGLLTNRALRARLSLVGQTSISRLRAYGITGLIGRSAGLLTDVRLSNPHSYGYYNSLSFSSFLGRRGDNFDRFLIRIKESIESFQLLSQVMSLINFKLNGGFSGSGFYKGSTTRFALDGLSTSRFISMESLISHFRYVSDGFSIKRGVSYRSVESPKGEVGVFLVSSGLAKPFRIKFRTPVSHNMNMLSSMSVDSLLADFVMTFCSFDIVLGEIDR